MKPRLSGKALAAEIRKETRALRQAWDDERFANFGAFLLAAKYGQDKPPTVAQSVALFERFFRTLPGSSDYSPRDFAIHYEQAARVRWFEDYYTGPGGGRPKKKRKR